MNALENCPTNAEFEMIMKYAEVLAKTPAYQSLGGMPGIFAVLLTAKELNMPFMQSLNGGIHLIPPSFDKNGNPKGAPKVMVSALFKSIMIRRAGHRIEEVEKTDSSVTLRGVRADTGQTMEVTFNEEMARKAQFSHYADGQPKSGSAWIKTPDDMYWKTCVEKLSKRLFADVCGSGYIAEVLEDDLESAPTSKVQSSGRKVLKGKNAPLEIEQIDKALDLFSPKGRDTTPKIPLEEWIESLGINIEGSSINDYVKFLAEKSNRTFDEMASYCYKKSVQFVKAFENYLAQLDEEREAIHESIRVNSEGNVMNVNVDSQS